MLIKTKISIGDIVLLFGDPKWRTVCTAITVRASGQVEYQIEWSDNGELKSEWVTAERLDCLSKITGSTDLPGFNLKNQSEQEDNLHRRAYGRD